MFSPIPGIKRAGEVLLRSPNTLPGFKLPHQKRGPEAKHPIEKRVDEWWKKGGRHRHLGGNVKKKVAAELLKYGYDVLELCRTRVWSDYRGGGGGGGWRGLVGCLGNCCFSLYAGRSPHIGSDRF